MSIQPEEVTFRSAGATLYGYVWPGPSTYVVMSHGLTNHHDDAPMFGLLRESFLASGFGVFMFDYFGSGKSDGQFEDKTWSGMRQNLADALDLVEKTLLERDSSIALVARSVGASTAGFFAKDPRIACTVLASPVLHLMDRFASIRSPGSEGLVRMPESLERSGQIKGEWASSQRFFDELEQTERELTEAVRGAQRVLVLHGDDDPKVAASNSHGIFQLLDDPKRYVGVEGGDHYYTGREKDVVDETLAWVVQYDPGAVAGKAASDLVRDTLSQSLPGI